MARDPKFGYHWVWITPVVFVVLMLSGATNKMRMMIAGMRRQWLDWRYPELKKLRDKAKGEAA